MECPFSPVWSFNITDYHWYHRFHGPKTAAGFITLGPVPVRSGFRNRAFVQFFWFNRSLEHTTSFFRGPGKGLPTWQGSFLFRKEPFGATPGRGGKPGGPFPLVIIWTPREGPLGCEKGGPGSLTFLFGRLGPPGPFLGVGCRGPPPGWKKNLGW